MGKELALNAQVMALLRRQQKQTVMVHSNQGNQFSSYDWQDFLKAHNLRQSMSRRRNCHDNAVAESFFQLLKRERIKRKTYATRGDARQDIFDYIDTFYNPKLRHGFNDSPSPVEFERRHFQRPAGASELVAVHCDHLKLPPDCVSTISASKLKAQVRFHLDKK